MKTKILLSAILALSLGSFANANAPKDSIAQKEAKVLQNKNAKEIEKAINTKNLIQAKKDATAFQKEAMSDKAKSIKRVVNNEIKYQQGKMKKAPKKIIEGVKNTTLALYALYHNDTKKAQEALEKATKNFDAALKENPKLKLVPIAEDIKVASVQAPIDELKEIINTSKKLLDKDRVQDVKALIAPLTDEMDIDVVSIPMELYPLATKTALEELKHGNKKAAFITLVEGVNTLVTTRVTIPLGLITAQYYVTEASKLDKNKKDEAIKLLNVAKYELEKARLLGYTTKHDKEYQSLQDQIEAIKKEIKGKNEVEKLYSKIKKDFTSLVEKTRKDLDIIGSPEQKRAQQKVINFEKKEHKEALKDAKIFLNDAKKDLNNTLK